MPNTCSHCNGRGYIVTDAELDYQLRVVLNAIVSTPIGADPDASTTAGIARKMGESEERIIASFERLAASGHVTKVQAERVP